MDEPRWCEIPATLGAALWSGYRQHMTGPDAAIHLYASASREGRAETQIGTAGGHYYLMRLVTTYDTSAREDWDGNWFPVRVNECTRYYLPVEVSDG